MIHVMHVQYKMREQMNNIEKFKDEIFNYVIGDFDRLKEFIAHRFAFEPLDAITRNVVQEFLQTCYNGKYIISCSDVENSPETISKGELNIRFRNSNANFILTIPAKHLSYSANGVLNDSI